jgi:nitric oxide reductase large subunit
MNNRRTLAFVLFVVVAAFSVLLFGGARIDTCKPPIPDRVVGADGRVVMTGDDIRAGQRYYLARGGQHMGSIWGHGAYLAPDWSANARHRVALVTAALHAGRAPAEARRFGQSDLAALTPGERGRVEVLTAAELKQNRYHDDTLSLAPAGFYQLAESMRHGTWYARSPAVTGSSFIHTVTWLRIVPDVVFDVGALALVAFLGRAILKDRALRRAEAAPASNEHPAKRAA